MGGNSFFKRKERNRKPNPISVLRRFITRRDTRGPEFFAPILLFSPRINTSEVKGGGRIWFDVDIYPLIAKRPISRGGSKPAGFPITLSPRRDEIARDKLADGNF